MKILDLFSLVFFPFVLILVGYLFLHFCIFYLFITKTTNKQTNKKTLEPTVQNDTGSNLWISRLH